MSSVASQCVIVALKYRHQMYLSMVSVRVFNQLFDIFQIVACTSLTRHSVCFTELG